MINETIVCTLIPDSGTCQNKSLHMHCAPNLPPPPPLPPDWPQPSQDTRLHEGFNAEKTKKTMMMMINIPSRCLIWFPLPPTTPPPHRTPNSLQPHVVHSRVLTPTSDFDFSQHPCLHSENSEPRWSKSQAVVQLSGRLCWHLGENTHNI